MPGTQLAASRFASARLVDRFPEFEDCHAWAFPRRRVQADSPENATLPL
jgi:hypothetical protein